MLSNIASLITVLFHWCVISGFCCDSFYQAYVHSERIGCIAFFLVCIIITVRNISFRNIGSAVLIGCMSGGWTRNEIWSFLSRFDHSTLTLSRFAVFLYFVFRLLIAFINSLVFTSTFTSFCGRSTKKPAALTWGDGGYIQCCSRRVCMDLPCGKFFYEDDVCRGGGWGGGMVKKRLFISVVGLCFM